ncbi:MAG: hypothetical protein JST75_22415 [Bacteroidetes bacterium]|nr:hypothetical protein [Bacteroidota bacterium]
MNKIKLIWIAIAVILMSGRCRVGNFFGDGRSGNYIKMTNGSVHEEIKYDGVIKLSDDEMSIDHISPNGYLMFVKDDEKLLVESNYHGQLVYQINDDPKRTTLDENGKKVLADLIQEMLATGFDAEARVERIYKKGGNAALLDEIEKLKSDNIKLIYFKKLLASDSLSENELTNITGKIGTELGSDNDKESLLNKYGSSELKYPSTAKTYLSVIEKLGSDNSKENFLGDLITKQEISLFNFDQFMEMIDHLGSDNAKENLMRQMITSETVPAYGYDHIFTAINHLGSDNAKENLLQDMINKKKAGTLLDKILQVVSSMGSDNEKSNIYRNLAAQNLLEEQWIMLINASKQLGNDNEKADVLIEIGQKMPATENTRSAYMQAAKSIGSDGDFGRVMKAIH